MPIFRWGHAFDAFRDIEREMDRMLRSVSAMSARGGGRFPALNLYERPDEYVAVALLPGVAGDGLDVSVADGVLTLSGERSREETDAEATYRRGERAFGRFERTISLPERVDEDGIAADFRDGVLRLTIPKAAPAPARRIAVAHDGGAAVVDEAIDVTPSEAAAEVVR